MDLMKQNGLLTKLVGVAKRNDAQLTIVNVIDSRTYSYEVYDAQFTENQSISPKNYLKGYKEVATNAGKNVDTFRIRLT